MILTDKMTDGGRAAEIFSEANKNKLQLLQVCPLNPTVSLAQFCLKSKPPERENEVFFTLRMQCVINEETIRILRILPPPNKHPLTSCATLHNSKNVPLSWQEWHPVKLHSTRS